jgi:hypothetical protein
MLDKLVSAWASMLSLQAQKPRCSKRPLYRCKGAGMRRSDVEIERLRRINVAAWAYAYEVENDPLVDDGIFDAEAKLIRPELSTGHDVLDQFFRTEFSPHTGMWVHKHPEKHKLAHMCATRRARLRAPSTEKGRG